MTIPHLGCSEFADLLSKYSAVWMPLLVLWFAFNTTEMSWMHPQEKSFVFSSLATGGPAQPPLPHTPIHHHPEINASLIPRITCGRWPPPFSNRFRPLPQHQMLPPKSRRVKKWFDFWPPRWLMLRSHTVQPIESWLFVSLPHILDDVSHHHQIKNLCIFGSHWYRWGGLGGGAREGMKHVAPNQREHISMHF